MSLRVDGGAIHSFGNSGSTELSSTSALPDSRHVLLSLPVDRGAIHSFGSSGTTELSSTSTPPDSRQIACHAR